MEVYRGQGSPPPDLAVASKLFFCLSTIFSYYVNANLRSYLLLGLSPIFYEVCNLIKKCEVVQWWSVTMLLSSTAYKYQLFSNWAGASELLPISNLVVLFRLYASFVNICFQDNYHIELSIYLSHCQSSYKKCKL